MNEFSVKSTESELTQAIVSLIIMSKESEKMIMSRLCYSCDQEEDRCH